MRYYLAYYIRGVEKHTTEMGLKEANKWGNPHYINRQSPPDGVEMPTTHGVEIHT